MCCASLMPRGISLACSRDAPLSSLPFWRSEGVGRAGVINLPRLRRISSIVTIYHETGTKTGIEAICLECTNQTRHSSPIDRLLPNQSRAKFGGVRDSLVTNHRRPTASVDHPFEPSGSKRTRPCNCCPCLRNRSHSRRSTRRASASGLRSTARGVQIPRRTDTSAAGNAVLVTSYVHIHELTSSRCHREPTHLVSPE